jgi:hypothetical protein
VGHHHRSHQQLELVWTGPVPAGTLRRSDQVMLDLGPPVHQALRSQRRDGILRDGSAGAFVFPVVMHAPLPGQRSGETMNYSTLLMAASLALTACNKEVQSSAPVEPTAATSAAETPPATPTDQALSVPKLGKLDEVDYEALKKKFRDAGWEVTGSATKSTMYAITLNLAKDGVELKLSYYKNGGDSWEKRLQKDGATIHKSGDVLVGVIVVQGGADPKNILDQLVG